MTKAAQLKKKPAAEEASWEWLAPLGLLGLVLLLSVQFVGGRPFGLDNDRSAQMVELGLATAAFAIIAWGYWLFRKNRAGEHQVTRDRLLVAIGFSAFLAYFNFGHLHFNNFVHVWDTYHYYMGAKYFPELGYERMYDCAMISDAESGRRDEVLRRTITDLRTNVIVKTDDLLAHPDERCKKYFTNPARWAAFKFDVNTWRSWVSEGRWTEIHHDHGYNATPVWTVLGMALTNTGPASMDQVITLNLLDPIYLALTLVIVWWAFGPRAFAMAALVLGTNFPNRYYWTGGAFLRHDWVFYLVASICLLKKEKPGLAGAAIAYSTLLRLFPGLIIIGPVIAAVEYFRVNKKLDPRFVQYVAGGVAATIVLLGLSTAFVGGLETWQRFSQNTLKHANTPLTNHMGLRTVLSWRPTATGSYTVHNGAIDPWAHWKEVRLEKWHEAKPIFYVIFGLSMLLVWLALRHSGPDPWLGAAFGVGFIVVGAELTNYYYCFLMGLAVLYAVKREVGLLISAMCALTLIIEIRPFNGMSGWLDEQYTAMTVATLIAIFGIWWAFTKWGAPHCAEPEPPAQLFPHLATAGLAPSANAAPSRKDERKKKKRR